MDNLHHLLSPCILCQKRCGADRLAGDSGMCGASARASVAVATIHHGEEPPISGVRGSGTIFFNGCSLGCVFCQNHQISRAPHHVMKSQEVSTEQLAERMLSLAARGVHNINVVTPTHYAPQIAHALSMARSRGLDLPVVYNSSGFDSLETLSALEPLVDVYMPDVKWLTAGSGERCARERRYHQNIEAVVSEMFRQKGPLTLNAQGIATRGVLIRHLVLPGGLSDSMEFLERFAPLIQAGVGVSLMAQYNPPPHGLRAPLDRTITPDEYYPLAYELRTLAPQISFIQELESHAIFNPDFQKPEPHIFD